MAGSLEPLPEGDRIGPDGWQRTESWDWCFCRHCPERGGDLRPPTVFENKRVWQHGHYLLILVPPARIELAAHGLGIHCSIHWATGACKQVVRNRNVFIKRVYLYTWNLESCKDDFCMPPVAWIKVSVASIGCWYRNLIHDIYSDILLLLLKRLLKKRLVLWTFFSTTTYTSLSYFGTYFWKAV